MDHHAASNPLAGAAIKPLGNLSLPVAAGEPFAQVLMDKLPPDLAGERLAGAIPEEANIRFDLASGNLSATMPGVVTDGESGLAVEPLWQVLDNAMVLAVDVYPRDALGNDMTPDRLADMLRRFTAGAVLDAAVLENATAQARKTGRPLKGVVLAKGTPPRHGQDGALILMDKGSQAQAQARDNDPVDFRERGKVVTVQPGDQIAQLRPHTTGASGRDVFGKVLEAKPGLPKEVRLGSGVTTQEGAQGVVLYTATEGGMVEFKGGTLAVSNLLVIATDVDMNSGNVHAPEGSVQIKGTVTSGSAVTAKENVLVEGVLENADVTAGGDVVVAFGILMDQAGAAIRAGGGVRAKFIRNATIQAKGDVVVEQDIVNSSIKADGRVLATGEKGSVRGGAIECSGLETTELGSDAGVPTTVTIAVAMPGLAEADARREQIRTRQAELDRLIGTDDPRNTLLLAPEEDRLLLGALLKLRARLNDELTELDEQRDNMLEAQGKELAKHRVVARKVVHQGTTINIANRSITLKKPEQASQFRWDWEKRGIGVSSA